MVEQVPSNTQSMSETISALESAVEHAERCCEDLVHVHVGHIGAALRLLRTAHEPDPVPPKDPTPEWVLKARAEGRAEFLAILLGESAEDFANDYTGTHSIGCTGDYGVHWEVEKLRASFVVDDETYSYIDTINGNWWSQQHQIETLQEELEELKRASQPPGALLADELIAWRCGCGWINLDRESPFCAGCDKRRSAPTKEGEHG
jgi:hypothetical protein